MYHISTVLRYLPAIFRLQTNLDSPSFTKDDQRVNHSDSTDPSQPKKNDAWNIPNSKWIPMCHPQEAAVTSEVDGYFLAKWKFPNEKARQNFVKAGFSKVTCLYFPLAKDDRIHFACRLLTLLFLIDDLLEDMSFEEGKAYNEKLMPISQGKIKPNRDDPAEYITYDLWQSMRSHDKELADSLLEPVFTFMRAQTDKVRLEIKELGEYLRYRERDVGKALLSALMRFSMDLRLTNAELGCIKSLEENCSKHLSVVNDIYSWEKEVLSSTTGHKEGAALCSAVKVISGETNLGIAASKRVLWILTREWELVHEELRNSAEISLGGSSENIRIYIKGLEYQMSGNELWSKTTLRYKVGN